jgi:orotate phosphoribosyltransferase-like protein
MKKEKIRNLEKKGWKVGTVSDFLNLSREEEEYIEMKLVLSHHLRTTLTSSATAPVG